MNSLKSINYTIHCGSSTLLELNAFLQSKAYSSIFILCDSNTLEHCLPLVLNLCPIFKKAEVLEVEPGESSKSLDIAAHIWQTLLDCKADKKTVIINLGGGVVSDLGGFVASLYKRGIDFINVPTSLLAMADACVGGKNGINFGDIKNSIGTITQPQGVFIYPDFLLTLSQRHINNGMAEIYKMGLIVDAVFWNKIGDVKQAISAENYIYKSVSLKNIIVKQDPLENGSRKALNFGHTIGHAIETTLLNTPNELLHGEAIIVGMIAEGWLSWKKKLLPKAELTKIIAIFSKKYVLQKIAETHFDTILAATTHDKKNQKKEIRCVLLNGIGQVKTDCVVTSELIKKALIFYNSIVKPK
jgi:3-dehydroquinate synthase